MLKIIDAPVRFDHKTWQEKKAMWEEGKPLHDYLIDAGFPAVGRDIIVSGKKIEDLKHIPKYGDEIITTIPIREPISTTIVAVGSFLASTAFTVGALSVTWGQLGLLALSIGYAVYSSTQQPKIPSFGIASNIGPKSSLDEGSPTYGWNGIQTTQSVGTAIPVICGEHRVGGNIINSYIWSDGKKQYLNILLALGHGELSYIDDILINGNPISNFRDVQVYKRYGTNDQQVIQHFEDLHNTNNISVQLTQNNPYIYTTTKSTVEAFEVHIQFPNGLFQQDEDSGDIKSWSVTHKIEYKVNGAGSWTTLGTFTISDKTRTSLKKVYRKDNLPPEKYDIRVTRTSEDSSFYKQGDSYLHLIDEIETQDLSYPGIALLGLRFLATEQLSGSMPNITCITRRKVSAPKVMNGANQVNWEDYYWDPNYGGGTGAFRLFSDDTVLSWDGSTYVDQFCAGPIWNIKGLLINNYYGLGEYIDVSHIDSSVLVEMGKYCEEKIPYTDENGNTKYRKRFMLNVNIDSQTRAIDLIMQLAATFMGIPFYSGGVIVPKIDKPEQPVQMFTMGNIVENSFRQKWKSIKDMPNVLEVQFLDKYKDYNQEQISIINEAALAAGEALRKHSMRLFVTSPEEALYLGRTALKVAEEIDSAIEFGAGIDAIVCQAADRIEMSHDVPQWGYSGRVKGGTTASVILDREVTIEAGESYEVSVQLSNDNIETKTVTNSPGTTDILTIDGSFSSAPQKYDKYAFGKVNISTKPYRVIGIRRKNKGEVTIHAFEYKEGVYDDSAVTIPQTNYSVLQTDIPDVTNLILTERIVRMKDGTIENVIDVWFEPPEQKDYTLGRFAKAKIYISDDNGESWRFAGETTGRHYQIIGELHSGNTYKVAVVSTNQEGMQNAIENSPQSSISLVGKAAPPSNVQNFNVEQAEEKLIFRWSPIEDADFLAYELRRGDSWETAVVIDKIFDGTMYQLPYFLSGSHTYFLKALDTSGNYSQVAASASITVTRRPQINVIITDYEFGRVGEANEMRIDSGLMWEWNNKFNSQYNRPAIRPKAKTKFDDDDLDWETLEEGSYEYDGDKDYGTFLIEPEIYDLGAVFEILFQVNFGLDFDDGVNMNVEARFSENGSDWTVWSILTSGFITARYFQLRLTFTTEDGKQFCLSDIASEFDVPDIENIFINVDISASGTDVVFDRPFTTAVSGLFVTALASNKALSPVIDPALITKTQFNCKLRNTETLSYEAGKISGNAKGY